MTPRIPTLLAQAGTGSALIWTLVLIVALLLMFGAVAAFRKWMRTDDVPTSGPGFTLSDLRRLHKEGKMTDEEFDKAKSVLIGTAKVGADKPVLGERQRPRTDPQGFDGPPTAQ
jgi:hypothetical protein